MDGSVGVGRKLLIGQDPAEDLGHILVLEEGLALIVQFPDVQFGDLGGHLQALLGAFGGLHGVHQIGDVEGRADHPADLAGRVVPGGHLDPRPDGPLVGPRDPHLRGAHGLPGQAAFVGEAQAFEERLIEFADGPAQHVGGGHAALLHEAAADLDEPHVAVGHHDGGRGGLHHGLEVGLALAQGGLALHQQLVGAGLLASLGDDPGQIVEVGRQTGVMGAGRGADDGEDADHLAIRQPHRRAGAEAVVGRTGDQGMVGHVGIETGVFHPDRVAGGPHAVPQGIGARVAPRGVVAAPALAAAGDQQADPHLTEQRIGQLLGAAEDRLLAGHAEGRSDAIRQAGGGSWGLGHGTRPGELSPPGS